MLAGKKVLAVITARGNSKGLPRKNLKELSGKPLIAWSIEAASRSKHIDQVIVSSEDDEILAVSRQYGAETPFVRPLELSGDLVPTVESVLHALDQLPGFDYAVLLQPTSPLRTTVDIDSCIELAVTNSARAAVSVTPMEKSAYWACTVGDDRTVKFLFDNSATQRRRQQLPLTYIFNGAVYVAQTDWLREARRWLAEDTLCYEMPRERSVDIDTYTDLAICETLMRLDGCHKS